MTTLHMVEIRPNLDAIVRFLIVQGLDAPGAEPDWGYGIHAWMAAAFGNMAPKPWRLLSDGRRPARILGYSQHDAQTLWQRMLEFADPSTVAVCSDPAMGIDSKPMPQWRSGRHLNFEVQCCPVGRKSSTGVEKDLFLIRADAAGDQPVDRGTIYCAWLRDLLERNNAATVTAIRMDGFRLVRQMRREQGQEGTRRTAHLIRPHALMRGQLVVNDPDAFTALLAHGVGRHRSFGYGMLLLRPPS